MSGIDVSCHKIWFADVGHVPGMGPDIPFDGIPYIIISYDVMECYQGPNRKSKSKVCYQGFIYLSIWSNKGPISNGEFMLTYSQIFSK